MTQWLRRLAVGVGVTTTALFLLTTAASLVGRRISARIAQRDFPPPGQVFEVNGRAAHIDCAGNGSPTILLESGLDDRGSWSWVGVRAELARISRVCAYDRGGILWSEPGESPRDAERLANELHALLGAAGETGPLLMVGHSLGGLLVRVYDARYPSEVAGFVFVDSSHPDQLTRISQPSSRSSMGLLFQHWLWRLAASLWVMVERDSPALLYRWRSLPEVWREEAAVPAMLEQAGRTGQLGSRPVVVLTATEGRPEATQRTFMELHRELAALSTNSDHRVVQGAGHYLHTDAPESVIAGIQDVVTSIREGAPVRQEVGGDAF
jgi:pimeloyl-ACP methyl ester carboxylesterase